MNTGPNSNRVILTRLLAVGVLILIGIVYFPQRRAAPPDPVGNVSAQSRHLEKTEIRPPINPRDTGIPARMDEDDPSGGPRSLSVSTPNFWNRGIHARAWWNEVPGVIRAQSASTTNFTNIRRKDYAGPDACRECHAENHRNWSGHSHSRMNALATPDMVTGDFSGNATIDYRGGTGRFFTRDGQYFMHLNRGESNWVYSVTRTIGSRFFQYYVGTLAEGHVDDDSRRKTVEHILPFGYWMDRKQWVPTVHVFRIEDADHEHYDPYAALPFFDYDAMCTDCHVTWPAGDWMLRINGAHNLKGYTPRSLAFLFSDYLAENHPDLLIPDKAPESYSKAEIMKASRAPNTLKAEEHAVALGITCESCHNGSREHAIRSTKDTTEIRPSFFFAGPQFFSRATSVSNALGHTSVNVNFACSKCHSSARPEYANGTHTWNSTEFADSVRGHCYNPAEAEARSMKHLTCVHCHDPHKGIGARWSKTPEEDHQSCLACHQQFSSDQQLAAHTHHSARSAGSHCMNCHMPRINEGLQEMVRTHRILNPTDRVMLEANQPNACNLCHLDQPIDWTLKHLRDWYGGRFQIDESQITRNYPERAGPVGLGWIRSPHGPTRLAAAEALLKAKANWALPDVIKLLDTDDYLINRQFIQRGLDEMLGIRLDERGYQFYMMGEERTKAVAALRGFILNKAASNR